MNAATRRKLIFIIIGSFVITLIFFVGGVFLVSQKPRRPPLIAKPTVRANPSPKKKTESPSLAEAHYKEMLLLKKKGLWWEEEVGSKKGTAVQVYRPSSVQGKAMLQHREEEQMLWKAFYSMPLGNHGTVIAMVPQSRKEKETEERERKSWNKRACFVKAVTKNGMFLVPSSIVPIHFIVKEGCSFLPSGTEVIGKAQVDVGLKRAIVSLEKAVIPGDRFIEVSGYASNVDGSYGIAYRIVRNDLKLALLDIIASGVAKGMEVASKAYNDEYLACGEWGCMKVNYWKNPTKAGIKAGVAEGFHRLVTHIARVWQRAPIVVEIVPNLPVSLYIEERKQS